MSRKKSGKQKRRFIERKRSKTAGKAVRLMRKFDDVADPRLGRGLARLAVHS